eukprot:SAG22_NODE_14_length_33165_cov_13.196698_8_plen_236_part_00
MHGLRPDANSSSMAAMQVGMASEPTDGSDARWANAPGGADAGRTASDPAVQQPAFQSSGEHAPPPASMPARPRPERTRSSAPELHLIKPETILWSASTLALCFFLWAATQALAAGVPITTFVAGLVVRAVPSGEGKAPSALLEFLQLLDLRSCSNMFFGFVMITQLDHFCRNLLVAALWAAAHMEWKILENLVKIGLIFFPRLSVRSTHVVALARTVGLFAGAAAALQRQRPSAL